MKRRNHLRRRGVVLLLILGLTAMFALSILTFMIVTSNMADTAQNQAKIDAVIPPTAKEDVGAALKNVLVGASNERNPIAPFSVLENMYGDWADYDSNGNESDGTFDAYVELFPNSGFATVTPWIEADSDGDGANDVYDWDAVKNLFEQSGGVLTFVDGSNIDADAWQNIVDNSSAFVLEKTITNPTNWTYAPGTDGQYWRDHYYDAGNAASSNNDGNQAAYKYCDYWHFRVELTDELKRFITEYGAEDVENFNTAQNRIKVRLNRPAFAGTGAGGFSPGELKDAQIDLKSIENWPADWPSAEQKTEAADLRIPFAFWGNAAAPDLAPFVKYTNSTPDFRSFWAHLTDVNFDAAGRDYNGAYRYVSDAGANWSFNASATQGRQNGWFLEPARMNPTRTAADSRSPFLARFNKALVPGDDLTDQIVPSFHRPSLFQTLVDAPYGPGSSYLDFYANAYSAAGKPDVAIPSLTTALLRKLTPRPLPLDHWNFDGGNAANAWNINRSSGVGSTDVQGVAGLLANPNDAQWDVDNDGDGIREGVWIPSGLPIRYDKEGTPYATMFSYTLVDLDGRVDVNAAGNWDQLPNNASIVNRLSKESGDLLAEPSQPYDYVDELADMFPSAPVANAPFYNAESLTGSFGWRDDSNNETSVAVRGDGLGPANVRLYEALSAIFDRSKTTGGNNNQNEIATIASNLLWRRGLAANENPTGPVDQTNLRWSVVDKNDFTSQPGKTNAAYEELDDSLGTQFHFFRLINPTRVFEKGDGTESETNQYTAFNDADVDVRFPWRGKTTADMNALLLYSPFDFANTAFRSYDPLGAQIFTYAPNYTDNPYLAYKNASSWYDSPYSLPMLERLLRPSDSDSGDLPPQLVDDLGASGDAVVTEAVGAQDVERERAAARLALTTISSDVPAPSAVFPDNLDATDDAPRGGSFGFADLIRRCVRAELKKVFKEKGLYADNYSPAANGSYVAPGNGENDYIELGANADVFDAKVEEIASYLIAALPPEIAAGQKIDLNKLSQKNYWLDVDYNVASNGKEYVVAASSDLHNVGLVKRMEYARGLYLVVMTLLYDDVNATEFYSEFDELFDYSEGAFDLSKFKEGDRLVSGDPDSEQLDGERGLAGKELLATRVAQWCVNAVDFADPDATMTPFFFDPTPFDGWWVQDNEWLTDSQFKAANGYNRWAIGSEYSLGGGNPQTYVNPGWSSDETQWPEIPFLFSSNVGVPTEAMEKFFLEALIGADKTNSGPSLYRDYQGNALLVKNSTTPKTDAQIIAGWLSQPIDDPKDQTSDLGFRLIWGMERPDLVLTETLNLHDLGIADTPRNKESNKASEGKVKDGGDTHFDQVKRPEGSTYLELYCAANPNVPQSPELYDYDATSGLWRLRLSKTTPVYTDAAGRELNMPIWRVAISDSSDPRALNEPADGASDDEKKKLKNSQPAVYRKAANSVLERLKPDSDEKEFNFFSMQTRQFRNLPLPTAYPAIDNIAKLDLFQGWDDAQKKRIEPDAGLLQADWKDFDLYSSNVLGAAFADKDENAKGREIELDRIVWFSSFTFKAEEDTAAEKRAAMLRYPDAFRTFVNESTENVYLAPNQYLIVGPELKRSLGSVCFNATAGDANDCRFGKDPLPSDAASWIDMASLATASGNCQYLVAKSLIETPKAAAERRGLNISEPLWTDSGIDPYYFDQNKKIDPTKDPIDALNGSRDIPFETPLDWENNPTPRPDGEPAAFPTTNIANYPIVQDKLFGVGTVPAYKSAFIQRVADPNRPYHPLLNPYLSVDWNAMDLTVFTGESVEVDLEHENQQNFVDGTNFTDKNQITVSEKRALTKNVAAGKLPYADAFSSRQWGNNAQTAFAPTREKNKADDELAVRPNPWARAVDYSEAGATSGLQKAKSWSGGGESTGSWMTPALKSVPEHTLGCYNNRGTRGVWSETTENGEKKLVFTENPNGTSYRNQYWNRTGEAVYNGAPSVPFEHLVWNDAPYSNPFELALVPASAPGRFGLEFVRTKDDGKNFDLKKLYDVSRSPNKGTSLGSDGVLGFGWYKDASDNDKKDKGKIGPNLNFFASSKKPGETLNLCRILDFVYTPSLFLGTKKLAGLNENGGLIAETIRYRNGDVLDSDNPIFHSTRREPGKVNINTLTKPVWKAISPSSERYNVENRLPGTAWDAEEDPMLSLTSARDWFGFQPYYFGSPQTARLFATLDQRESPIPSFSTLLTGEDAPDEAAAKDPLFDSIGVGNRSTKTNDAGDELWERVDGTGSEITYAEAETEINGSGGKLSWNDYRQAKTGAFRDNLYEATAEMQRLSGVTTTRSNAFAVWVTVGYFEVERCKPGVNMPNVDPEGNSIVQGNANRLLDPTDKWYQYYQAIYPDGYTYGRELGAESGETKRRRGFAIIDRSIPVDYRRGSSVNYQNAVLLQRILD